MQPVTINCASGAIRKACAARGISASSAMGWSVSQAISNGLGEAISAIGSSRLRKMSAISSGT
ncbi:hypothetical protein D9M69_734470 [compost metagenome]